MPSYQVLFQSPGPILLRLGPLVIRYYGVMIAAGFLAATFAGARLAKRWELSADAVINSMLVWFIGGILGARLYFVALSWSYFQFHPQEILATWKGGLSIHGGIVGALVSGWFYSRYTKIPFLTCCDIGGAVAGLGQSIGRWGNFFNSEAFGKPVSPDFLLRLYIPPANRPTVYQTQSYFHPTFLYEALWDLTVFAILYYVLADRLRPYPGTGFLLYLALYSVGRLLVEPLRVDSIMLAGMPAPIIVSALSLIFSVIALGVLLAVYRSKSQARS